MKLTVIAALGAAVLAVSGVGAMASQGGGGKERFRCKAKAADLEFQARYETKAKTSAARRKFRVEVEGDDASGLTDGQELWISIDGANVGVVTVEAFDDGEIAGETRFDSRAKGESLPFPSNFPAIAAGSEVSLMKGEAVLIGCTVE